MEKPEEYRIDHRERYYILDVHNFFYHLVSPIIFKSVYNLSEYFSKDVAKEIGDSI